jgi:phosphate transport system permease protein
MTQRARITGAVLHALVALAAVVTGVAIFVIAAFLVISAWPAIVYNGTGFLTSVTWNSGNQYGDAAFVTRNGAKALAGSSFGILVFIAGTLLSSGIAMLFATPLAILTAIALVYRVPPRLKGITTTLVELMAGVPSVVFGLWGAIVLVPLVERVIPFLGTTGSGYGLITAAIILALMVLPIMAAMMRDLLLSVSQDIIEGSVALGATMWQTVARVALPAIGAGMSARCCSRWGARSVRRWPS